MSEYDELPYVPQRTYELFWEYYRRVPRFIPPGLSDWEIIHIIRDALKEKTKAINDS